MSKRALILIDIQNDYFASGKWSLEGMDGATANAARVLAAARQAGDKVIHVRHEFESADAPFFVPGSAGANIHPQVQPLASEVVVLKHQVNAFLGTDLKAQLDAAGLLAALDPDQREVAEHLEGADLAARSGPTTPRSGSTRRSVGAPTSSASFPTEAP